jgi:hypothetical protein
VVFALGNRAAVDRGGFGDRGFRWRSTPGYLRATALRLIRRAARPRVELIRISNFAFRPSSWFWHGHRVKTKYLTLMLPWPRMGASLVIPHFAVTRLCVAMVSGLSTAPAIEPESWVTHFVAPWTVSDVVYGAGLFAASADVPYTSPDGVTWTRRAIDLPAHESLRGIAFGNDRFVAVAEGAAFVSADGISWQRSADLPQDDPLPVIKRVEFGGSVFLAVGQERNVPAGTGSHWLVMTSPDGVAWTKKTGPAVAGESHYLNTGTYGNGLYVVAGWSGLPIQEGLMLTSPDLVTWTPVQSALKYLEGLSYRQGMFVAVGGGIATSPDGIHWTKRVEGLRAGLSEVAFGPDSIVAVGDSKLILSSIDGGVTWKEHVTHVDGFLGVSYGDGSFVAVGGYYTNLPRGVAAVSGGTPRMTLEPLGFGPPSNPGFRLRLTLEGGNLYRLQSSPTWPAASWTDVDSIVFFANQRPDTMELIDPTAPPTGERFYRVVSP